MEVLPYFDVHQRPMLAPIIYMYMHVYCILFNPFPCFSPSSFANESTLSVLLSKALGFYFLSLAFLTRDSSSQLESIQTSELILDLAITPQTLTFLMQTLQFCRNTVSFDKTNLVSATLSITTIDLSFVPLNGCRIGTYRHI
jgi:hypothetical protein